MPGSAFQAVPSTSNVLMFIGVEGIPMAIDLDVYRRPPLAVATNQMRTYAKKVHKRVGTGDDPRVMQDISAIANHFRCTAVNNYIYDCCGLEVQSGPFRGMKYIREASGSLFGPKILGCYEAELHPVIETINRYARFVNVGCAEGYYAVGARLLSETVEIHAFDTDPLALENCRMLADLNGVADSVRLGGECTGETLSDLARPGTLALIDIEGAEIDLLNAVPIDKRAILDLVIETHTVQVHGLTLGPLVDLLSPTHDIAVVDQKARDWNQFPALRPLGQFDRFIATWEGRGSEPWLIAKAKTRPV
jgi:hypothetical protein